MQLARRQELGMVLVVAMLSIITFFGCALLILNVTTVSSAVIGLILLGIIWSIATTLALAFSFSGWAKAILILLPALALPVAGKFHSGAWGGAILLALVLVLAERTQRREIQDRIKFRVSTVFSGGLRLTIISFLLALAGLILPVAEQSLRAQGLAVSEKQVEAILTPLQPILNNFGPSANPNLSVDTLIDQQVASNLPPGTELTAAQRAQLREQIAEQFDVEQGVSGSETLTSLLTRQVNSVLRDLTQQRALLASIVIVILVFLTLRPLVPLFVLLLLPLVSALLGLLQRVGLIAKQTQTVSIERLILTGQQEHE